MQQKESSTLQDKRDVIIHHNSNDISIEEDEIDLRELFATIKDGWKIILLVSIVTFMGTLFYLSTVKDVYQAETLVMPLKGRTNMEMELLDNTELALFKDMMQASMPTVFSSPTTSKIRSTVLSKEFLLYLIEKYKLLPYLFESQYDTNKNSWVDSVSCSEIQKSKFTQITGITSFEQKCHPTLLDGYRKLLLMINVDRSQQFKHDSNLIQISVESIDPIFAQMLLNKLIVELDKKLRQKAIKLATDNQEYFASLLAQSSNKRINSRLQTLLTAQMEQALFAQTKANFLFEVVDPAIVPDMPVKPKRPLILVVSLVTSLILGIFLVFFLNFIQLNKKEENNEN